MKKCIKIILILLLLSIFIYCTYNVINYLKNEYKNVKLNSNIQKIAIKEVIIDNDNKPNDISPIQVDFDKLDDVNNNIQAWIYLNDSNINYPIVQGNDNNYYLSKTVDGDYNPNGSLFIDYRNSKDFSDPNTYIYGHNMKNDTMFGDLEKYKKQEYYDNHKEMYILTRKNQYKLEVFAGYTTEDGSEIYNFIGNDSNERLIELAMSKSDFSSDVKVDYNDKVVVLSTCSYDYENARYVLIGVLRKI